ncbi:MAG: zf-HC2 domain-containing protein [Candidatus Zixiibacteriota bacterium]
MFLFGDTCTRIKRLLSERVDEALSPRLEKKVRRHLCECEQCRQEAAFYENIKLSAAKLDDVQPPDYLWERISLSIDEHPWGEEKRGTVNSGFSWRSLLFGSINYTGAALTFALIAVLCFMPGGSTDTKSDSGTSIRAEEIDTDMTYISLYMMSHDDRFPYEVRDYYLNKLVTLDRQITTIKMALEKYPNNRQVREQLARAYAQKLQMYEQMGISIPQNRYSSPVENGELDRDILRGRRYE